MKPSHQWYVDHGIGDYDEIKELVMFGALLEEALLSEPETDDPSSLSEELWNRERDKALRDSEQTDEWLAMMEDTDA